MRFVYLLNSLVAPQIGLYMGQNNQCPTYTFHYVYAKMSLGRNIIQTEYSKKYRMETCLRYTMASVSIMEDCVFPALQFIAKKIKAIFLLLSN